MTHQIPHSLAIERFRRESQEAVKRQSISERLCLDQIDKAVAKIGLQEAGINDPAELEHLENSGFIIFRKNLGEHYPRLGMQGLSVVTYDGHRDNQNFRLFAVNKIRPSREKKFGLVSCSLDMDGPINFWQYVGREFAQLDPKNGQQDTIAFIADSILAARPKTEDPVYL